MQLPYNYDEPKLDNQSTNMDNACYNSNRNKSESSTLFSESVPWNNDSSNLNFDKSESDNKLTTDEPLRSKYDVSQFKNCLILEVSDLLIQYYVT